MICFFRYHTDGEIKRQFAEIEKKHVTIANFDANDNEITMAFPSLRVTEDVSQAILSKTSKISLNFPSFSDRRSRGNEITYFGSWFIF